MSKITIVELTSKNYRRWIREIKGQADAAKVWQYVDPDKDVPIPDLPDYPTVGDFQIPAGTANDPQRTVAAEDFTDLSDKQINSYKFKLEAYKHKEREIQRIDAEIRKIRNMVMESARMHTPSSKSSSPPRDIVKMLQQRFKKDDNTLLEEIHTILEELRNTTPTKDKIEQWIAQRENLRDDMQDQGVIEAFSERRMTIDFLKAGHNWAPNFCTNWVLPKEAAEKPLRFLETTAVYREAVEEEKETSPGRSKGRAQANASFQKKTSRPAGEHDRKSVQKRVARWDTRSECFAYSAQGQRMPVWPDTHLQ